MPTGVAVVGIDAALRGLRGARAALMPAFERALQAEGEAVFARTQELVPVDTTALKKSGVLHKPEIGATTASIAISYGNDEVDYALVVHEDLVAKHKAPTQAKYVEIPVIEASKGMAARVGARVGREIGGRR